MWYYITKLDFNNKRYNALDGSAGNILCNDRDTSDTDSHYNIDTDTCSENYLL